VLYVSAEDLDTPPFEADVPAAVGNQDGLLRSQRNFPGVREQVIEFPPRLVGG